MSRTDLARARAATLNKRPAEVTRAVPLTAVRAVPRARVVPTSAAGRLARFNDWRRDHYVADQLLRLAAIFAGVLACLALAAALAVWAVRWIAGELGGVLAGLGGLLGVAAFIGVILLVLNSLGGGHGHSCGEGFHWSKCK